MIARIAVVGASLIILSGCATVMGGSRQNITLNSEPSGATVKSDKGGMRVSMTYTTPATVAFQRKGSYILTFSKEGYDSKQIELQKSIRGWMLFWDILWFPISIIDPITGAWYRLTPDNVSVTLNKLDASILGPEQINISIANESESRFDLTSDIPVSLSVRNQ